VGRGFIVSGKSRSLGIGAFSSGKKLTFSSEFLELCASFIFMEGRGFSPAVSASY
jgi:hypothetical protein